MSVAARKNAAKRLPPRSHAAPKTQRQEEILERTSSKSPSQQRRGGSTGRNIFNRKRSQETNEWLMAGALFASLIVTVVVGIHVIGGSHASTTVASTTGFGSGRSVPAGFGSGRQSGSVVTAVATTLGISGATLTADLQAGQTIAQIAAAQQVTIDTVNSSYLNAAKQQFDQAVSSGFMTQTQADQLYSQQQVAAGQYPLLQSAGNTATATPTA